MLLLDGCLPSIQNHSGWGLKVGGWGLQAVRLCLCSRKLAAAAVKAEQAFRPLSSLAIKACFDLQP